ncbi:CHC2 zinc finger domain-containing protein [Candidatus Binatia bacterium]|nr:CHC2 zinc finger domain-containing protein [Candidatus Binatia bacterium]
MPPIDFAALRDAVRVADVLGAHGHELRRDGRCCCPLCGSANPSTLSTYADGSRWRCWACGAHGDALDMERQLAGCDLRTAAATLAGWAGLSGTPTARREDVARSQLANRRRAALLRWAHVEARVAADAARDADDDVEWTATMLAKVAAAGDVVTARLLRQTLADVERTALDADAHWRGFEDALAARNVDTIADIYRAAAGTSS